MNKALLSLQGVVRNYRTGAEVLNVLKGVNLALAPGELVGLLVSRTFKPLIPKRLRAVKATDVAAAMLQAALIAPVGQHVIESDAIARRR